MRCRRESAGGQRGNGTGKAGTTTSKRAPIVLRRGENRLLCGTSHTAQGGHAEKVRSFREKTADLLQKTPNFRARTPGFCLPALRRTTKQRKHRTSTGGRALPNAGRTARSPRCATSHCAAPPSRNETMGCRRATGSTTKRPSPLESRKGAQALRSAGGNSRCGSAARGAIRICVPTLGDSQGAWSRETRRCHTGAHALSRRRTRRLS